jgi:hypothetical protein
MKQLLLIFLASMVVTTTIFAQNKPEETYKLRAAEVREEIWGMDIDAFSRSEIPAQYNNESAVVLAKYYEVTNTSKTKFKVGIGTAAMTVRMKYFTTIRQRVWINDKSALEEFSTIEYKKTQDNSTTYTGFIKLLDTYSAFIGVKVTKKDGKIIDVNADEEVLTKNDNDDQEGRLAIPDLQVGDIVDYYIRIEKVVENTSEQNDEDYIFLGGEYPVLYLQVRYDLAKNNVIHLVQANGAKPVEVKKTEEGNLILEFTETNLEKFEEPIWSTPVRQYPYYAIRYFISDGAADKQIVKDTVIFSYKEQLNAYYTSMTYQNYKPLLIEKYGSFKKVKEQPLDSIINYMYNYFKWQEYDKFDLTDIRISNSDGINERDIFTLREAVIFSHTLKAFDIDHDLILCGSRKYNTFHNALTPGDIYGLIRINHNGKIKYLGFNDYFTIAGDLPAEFEGEHAAEFDKLNLDWRGSNKTILPTGKTDENETTVLNKNRLPFGKSEENMLIEEIKLQLDPINNLDLQVDRTCRQTGAMKNSDQHNLLLAEDIEATFAQAIGKPSKVARLKASRATAAKGNELQAAFDKERNNQKDYFKSEITSQFEQEPKELKSFKVIQSGLTFYDPVFEYQSSFVLDGFMKKAGQNYILEVGRLIGQFKKTEEKDRTRTLDIYMIAPRSLNYNISFEVPPGFKVKGLEELNNTVSNVTGSFSCEAIAEGNTIKIKIKRVYQHAFEKAGDWPLMLEHLDATAAFNGQKILLEKI